MRHSTVSPTAKTRIYLTAGVLVLSILAVVSLFAGKYPLTLQGVLSGDTMQLRVFQTLRVPRTLVALCGGVVLGITGYVYQTIFHNPLASPDIVGVSSGASAGAAFGILFLGSAWGATTISAFAGALIAVCLALFLAALDKGRQNGTIVLCGIAVHALAQTLLMFLKLAADPEKQLASIEYWIMGSLNGVTLSRVVWNLWMCVAIVILLALLLRQVIMLSNREDEAKMLGMNVGKMRLVILIISTCGVAAVISMTGLVSFVGLLSPHISRKLHGSHQRGIFAMSGLVGGCLLLGADILARCVAQAELPVSIFTSLLGAPFLLYLAIAGRKGEQ